MLIMRLILFIFLVVKRSSQSNVKNGDRFKRNGEEKAKKGRFRRSVFGRYGFKTENGGKKNFFLTYAS